MGLIRRLFRQLSASIFVPNNPVDVEVLKEDPKAKTNYEEAKEAAEKAGLDIEVVPVKTVQEAIDYLKKREGRVNRPFARE